MNTSQIYIMIAIASFVFVVILFLAARKKGKKLTPLVGFAWALILAGIIFSEDRLIGYSLIGVGVALAVLDIFITHKRNQPGHALLQLLIYFCDVCGAGKHLVRSDRAVTFLRDYQDLSGT